MTQAPVLAAHGVRKTWRRAAHPVLDGVDLEVPAGTLCAVAGRNGVGKTTFLRAVAGILVPEEGTVEVCGRDVTRRDAVVRRLLSFLPAGNSGLYARLDVLGHLDLWARVAYVDPARRRAEIERVAELFGLGAFPRSRTDRLSMGQRQRVRLAMAFLGSPRLILLDEPTTSLDDEGRATLAAAVRDVLDRGGAVVWCAPSHSDVALPPQQALTLEGGRLG